MPEWKLLEELCNIHAPSGEEYRVFDYIQQWLNTNHISAIVDRSSVVNAMIIKKGFPSVAFLIHVDTVGFIKEYASKVLPIGSPTFENEVAVKNETYQTYTIYQKQESFAIDHSEMLETGTTFTYVSKLIIDANSIQGAYLDNRIHVAIALECTIKASNFLIVFTSNEEISGGCTEKVARVLYEHYHINKAIVLDTTFVSDGILLGYGIVLSLKDNYLPSRQWIEQVKTLLMHHQLQLQLEVADFGSSDGAYISKSPYPIEWCFLGIACEDYHSPHEKVSQKDIALMKKALTLMMDHFINFKYV